MRAIPSEIRRRSALAGYHPAAFARAVEISEGHLSRILNGERPGSPGVLKRMADKLGCEITNIAEFVETPADVAS